MVRIAVGPSPRRLPVIPWLFVLLTVLTFVPVSQALFELIVRPVTVGELVDRQIGLATRLVAVDGYVLLVPFDADPPSDAASASSFVYHWFAVRDSLQELRVVLVRSIIAPRALRERSVVARVVDDPGTVSGARAGIVARGGTDPSAVAPLLLTEVRPQGESIRELRSLAELGQVPVGQVVRITLRFEAGIASCVAHNSCQARQLANGAGTWDNLARDPASGGWAVVRTEYPPSVAPFQGVGQHAQDPELLASVLAQPLVRGMLGWASVLRVAHVEQDLGLPINHLWAGPILFTALGTLLFVGLRVGYPRFRVTPSIARQGAVRPISLYAALQCRASGRITPRHASPFEARDLPATLRADAEEGAELSMEAPGGRRSVTIPHGLGGLGSIEVGEVLTLSRVSPALKVSWFGNNVLLVFSDASARNAAAAWLQRSP